MVFLFLNFISCSCMFAYWSWLETAFWGLRELLTYKYSSLFFFFPPFFHPTPLPPHPSSLFTAAKFPCFLLLCPLFLCTCNALIPGIHILSASMPSDHFLTTVNHILKVLSTTTHRSLCSALYYYWIYK